MEMGLVEGQSLAECLREKGPMPASKAADLAVQLCDSLALAHKNGIIHRDINRSGEVPGVWRFGSAMRVIRSIGLHNLWWLRESWVSSLRQKRDRIVS